MGSQVCSREAGMSDESSSDKWTIMIYLLCCNKNNSLSKKICYLFIKAKLFPLIFVEKAKQFCSYFLASVCRCLSRCFWGEKQLPKNVQHVITQTVWAFMWFFLVGQLTVSNWIEQKINLQNCLKGTDIIIWIHICIHIHDILLSF